MLLLLQRQLSTFEQLPSYLARTTTSSSAEMKKSTPLLDSRTWSTASEDDNTFDIIIECSDRTFYAHRDAVYAHSQKLQDAYNANTQVRELYIRIAHTNEADR